MNQDVFEERSQALPAMNNDASQDTVQGLNSKEQTLIRSDAQREILLNYGSFEYEQAAQRFLCSPGVHHLFGNQICIEPMEEGTHLIEGLSDTEQEIFWNLLKNEGAESEEFEQHFTISGPLDHKPKTVSISGVYTGTGAERKVLGLMVLGSVQKQIDEETRRHIMELERSNNDLEGFAYVASHDLQEPLRKIVTFADMLLSRQNTFGEKEKDYLVRIHKSAYDMRALIENLLEFSHIGIAEAAETDISLNVVVRQSLSDLEVKINTLMPTIKIDPLPELCVDPERMRRVFTNLLGNALKFGKKDEPLFISISARQASTEEVRRYLPGMSGRYTRITIEDNGIGFEKEYEQRIFQIFQRLHGRSSYPGSGLGLAICRKIIEQHQGFIYAEGEKGKGASFHILLPMADCED